MAGRPNANGPPNGQPRVPSEEELGRYSREELVRRLRWTEGDRLRRIAEHSSIMKDVNRRMQALRNEARAPSSGNGSVGGGNEAADPRLLSDNQELRDLCCFLDDDRQKGRSLAQEWQRFGRYSAGVLRTEVAGYQEKLAELELRQEQLLQENLELRELCFLLDQERQQGGKGGHCGQCGAALAANPGGQGVSSNNNDDTSAYIRHLEDKLHAMEMEKRQMEQGPRGASQYVPPLENGEPLSGKPKVPQKPPSMAHALKVLEVHNKLEHGTPSGSDTEHMNDNHKAIVREMCNVVWRKLGDDPTRQQTTQPPSSAGAAPQRYRAGPAGPPGTPPRYTGSTGSLDRKGI